jgi:poly-gamma-glutamate system protein
MERRRRLTSSQWSPSVWELVIVCVIGIGMIFAAQRMRTASSAASQQMRVAAETMQSATTALATHRNEFGPPLDLSVDINGTGLIGSYFTPITTTVGNLEAKRTSTNPNMASVLVSLLQEVDVRPGDFIAVGASGSFPALILATASAAQALDLQMGLILSLGSSQFGANNLEFTWLEMARILVEEDLVVGDVLAASLGGDLDIARDLSAEVRASLTEKIDESTALFIHEPDLVENVNQRMSIYRMAAGDKPISAFINIGGAWANMGVDASILTAAPGVIHADSLPDESSRGVIHAMVAEGVPVIHLLNMKELVQRHGIPWDPSPLPSPSDSLTASKGMTTRQQWAMASYLTVAAIWLGSVALRRRQRAATN